MRLGQPGNPDLSRRREVIIRNAVECNPLSLRVKQGVGGRWSPVAWLADRAHEREPAVLAMNRDRTSRGRKECRPFSSRTLEIQHLLVYVARKSVSRLRGIGAAPRGIRCVHVIPAAIARG